MKVYQLMKLLDVAPAGAEIILQIGDQQFDVSHVGPNPDMDIDEDLIICAAQVST